MERSISIELVVIAGLLWFGYVGGRLARRCKLPEVTGLIILGIIIGPRLLNLITPEILNRLSFVNPLALGLITFGIGERLRISSLREVGFSIIGIAAAQALGAAFLVFVLLYIFGTSLPVAMLLGTIAAATAPITVMAVLREMKAGGRFTNSLLAMVALDNIFSISLFAILLPIASWKLLGQMDFSGAAVESLKAVGGAIFVGFIIGLVLSFMVRRIETSGELLLFVIGHVLLGVAMAELLGFSLLLTTLVVGLVTGSFSTRPDERERIFGAISIVESMVFAIFFVLAGASMHIELLPKVGAVTFLYVVGRSLGKIGGSYGGSYLGRGVISGHSWLLGFGLLPQAGAAIGLAIAARQALGNIGEELLTIILAAVAFFELLGPLTVRFSLARIGEAGLAANEMDKAHHLPKKGFTRILVPTAGPIPAARIKDTIKDLALKLGASVLVIYVQRTRSVQNNKKGEEALAVFKQLEQDGVKIETRTIYSENVPAKIIEVARNEAVDLIVMGATQAGWVKKRMLSSITEKVMLDAPCPVLEVPFERRTG